MSSDSSMGNEAAAGDCGARLDALPSESDVDVFELSCSTSRSRSTVNGDSSARKQYAINSMRACRVSACAVVIGFDVASLDFCVAD